MESLVSCPVTAKFQKAECEEAIRQTKHMARVLERRVVEVANTAKDEKLSMMVVLQGRAEARQKMFNHLKQMGDMTQVS